jgi:hypothetical protein
MNERLRQLMVQADYPAPEIALRAQKLAQLIVRECITIVDEQKECLHEEQKYWHDRDYGYALAVDDASKGIKQFFGVEE